MFRAVCRSSSGAPTVFVASGLHTHVVTARSQVWVGTDIKFINAKQAIEIHAYKNTKRKLYKTNAAIWFNKKSSHSDLTTGGHHMRV